MKLAMIGSGPSALYLLKHVLDEVTLLKRHLQEIVVFEKSPFFGMGMPYNPLTTDRFNLANIASEEMPPLHDALVDWLRGQDARDLEEMGVESDGIDPGKIYPRLVLGRCLQAQ